MTEYIVRESGYPGTIKKEIVGEIVRCKDCKHNPKYSTDDACPFVEESGCYAKYFPEDDGFCKWGERRDDEQRDDD